MKKIKCVLLDLDGTVYLGNKLFPFTLDFLARLDRLNIRYIFLTNNSSRGTQSYIDKFASMGICADYSKILISSHAAADYINTKYKNKRVFILGTESMKNEMAELGINLCEDKPEVLLAGFDTSLTFEKLTKFTNYVNSGLPYIATHPDYVCPAENGFLPDLGSFMDLIYACTHRRPEVVCGKPNEQILIAAEHKTAFDRSEMLMVGDRLMTDIALGQHGIRCALVLSGEAKIEEVDGAKVKPTYIFPSIKELGDFLESNA